MHFKTVLFDLDGTLADTAPDLVAALNKVLVENNRAALPFEKIRPKVSHGGIVMLRFALGLEPHEAPDQAMRDRFLDIYRNNIAAESRLFDGMPELLDYIEANGLNWGIVTNKPAWLTDPLVDELGLAARAACVVSGDTTANAKPHPEPMLHAASLCQSEPGQCLYVGDAKRDIEAGAAAGMQTLVALFGYLEPDDDPKAWGADGMVQSPAQIIDWIRADTTG